LKSKGDEKVKKVLISGMVALLVALMVTMAVQAAPPEPFYFEKDCSTFPTCTIQNSDLAEVDLNGGTLTYDGPVLGNPHGFIISSEVLLEIDGGTAMGHFTFVLDHGYFTFRQGTGSLEGFHAQGEIGWFEGTWVFPMEGTYHFKP